jgi:hypothetical protein
MPTPTQPAAVSIAASHRVRAQLIRKVSGSTDLTRTLRRAVSALARSNIPSLVVGGYAVQEHGYARFTSDIDLVVPDVAEARAVLSMRGFRENAGSTMTLTDRVTKVEVDLLPGGGSVGPGPLPLPIPTVVSAEPTLADLRTLVEIKLSSYLGSPASRLRDLADVNELIKLNEIPRDFPLDPAVQAHFQQTWDALEAEKRR